VHIASRTEWYIVVHQGETRTYNKLVETLTAPLDSAAVVRWFSALTRCVSLMQSQYQHKEDGQRIQNHHRQLVDAVLMLDWTQLDPTALGAVRTFLVHLVCSNGRFLPVVGLY
jgi:hypothetical protein